MAKSELEKQCDELLRKIESDYSKTKEKRQLLNKLEASNKSNAEGVSNFSFNDDISETGSFYSSDDTEKFENFVGMYLPEYKNIDGSTISFEDILSFLPKNDNGYFNDLIYRLIMESKREIAEWTNSAVGDAESLNDEDLAFYYDYIDEEERKISLLKKALTYKFDDSSDKEVTKNEMILVPTPNGNIRIIEDLLHISPEYYPAFLELVKSIEDGSFLGFKYITNDFMSGLLEVKGFKVRVLFSRLRDNCYAVIAAFVKKSDCDKQYRANLLNRYLNFKMHEDQILKQLDNPEFIEANKLQVEELYRVLGSEDSKELKRGELHG